METSVLSEISLFNGIPPEEAELLEPLVVLMEATAGEILSSQGEPANNVYFVVSGKVETHYRSDEQGLNFFGRVLGPGDDLGLAEALSAGCYGVTSRVKEDARVVSVSASNLEKVALTAPGIGAVLRRTLARRAATPHAESSSVDLARLRIEDSAVSLIPKHLIQKYRALPLARSGAAVVVGFVDLNDLGALDDVRRLLAGFNVRPVSIDPQSFEQYYKARLSPVVERGAIDAGPTDRLLKAVQKKTFELRIIEPVSAVEDKSRFVSGEQVVILLNRIIGEAMELSASDIHIEASDTEMVVRYRVDGLLCRRPGFLDIRFHQAVVARLKALGQMDIADRRRAQDGRLEIQHGNNLVELRLSTVPTRYGEKIVLRILDPTSILIDMERLITHEPSYKAMRWMIDQPQGIVIITGPTGSGKTTTIYSAMLRLRKEAINIVTIEDPIEYTVQGVTQVQVNDAAGVSFANSIRHFLRQDPDVVVVGEIRDHETAATSVEASLTGHLVVTTLHANDVFGTIVRLREMGIEPFLLAHSLVGVVNQRLVRRICARCRQPATWHADLIRPMGLFSPEEEEAGFTFYRGKGCIHCNDQGFRGRVGVFETLRVHEGLRPAIASGEPGFALEKIARREGLFHPLREYCRYLLLAGITTPEEIARVLFTQS